MKIILCSLLILTSCHFAQDSHSISDLRLGEIIDSLKQEITKRDSQIDQIELVFADACISSQSNVLKLGEEYHAEICRTFVPYIKNNNYGYFVVIDSLCGSALNDTIRMENDHFLFNFKTKKKGIHELKGRIVLISNKYGEFSFATNFKVE